MTACAARGISTRPIGMGEWSQSCKGAVAETGSAHGSARLFDQAEVFAMDDCRNVDAGLLGQRADGDCSKR